MSLVLSPPSASAEESDGLLGGVGTLVGVVDDTLDATGTVVAPIVESVADAGQPDATGTVTDLAEAAPAPTAPAAPAVDAVPGIIRTSVDVSDGTLDAADEAAVDTSAGLAATLTELASSEPVAGLADPIVDALDGVAGGLPLVGDLLGDDTLGGILGPVTGLVDDTLDTVVGDLGPLPVGGILPSLPGVDGSPGATPALRALDPYSTTPPSTGDPGPPGAATVETGAGATGSAAPLGTVGSPTAPTAPLAPRAPLGAPANGSAGAGAAGAAGMTSDAASAALELDALASLVLGSVDDALPSSPVYDTDTTPD